MRWNRQTNESINENWIYKTQFNTSSKQSEWADYYDGRNNSEVQPLEKKRTQAQLQIYFNVHIKIKLQHLIITFYFNKICFTHKITTQNQKGQSLVGCALVPPVAAGERGKRTLVLFVNLNFVEISLQYRFSIQIHGRPQLSVLHAHSCSQVFCSSIVVVIVEEGYENGEAQAVITMLSSGSNRRSETWNHCSGARTK